MNNLEILQRLKSKDMEGYQQVLKSQGPLLFTLCHYLCLNVGKFEQELFRSVLKKAVREMRGLEESAEMWLFGHLFREWLAFAKNHSNLQSQYSALNFDWSRSMGRQGEDALVVFSPLERIVFLYRFHAGFSLGAIQKMTGLTDVRLSDVFHNAIERVSAV